MSDLIIISISIAIGFGTGIATGLFGIGGGIIYIPSLFFLLEAMHVPNHSIPYIVIATSLFAGSFGSFSAFLNHFRAGNVNMKIGIMLASGSIIAALTVPYLVVDLSPSMLKIILAVVLCFVAIRLLLDDSKFGFKLNLNNKLLLPMGFIVGTISAVTGLGGGILFVPIILYLFNYEVRTSIGSSTLPVTITMMLSSFSYGIMNTDLEPAQLQLGYINLMTGLPLGIGAIIGSKLGVHLVSKYNPIVIKRLFSLLIVVVIIKIISSI